MTKAPIRYLVLDSETTGVDKNDKMVEIAWAEVDENFEIIDRRQSLLDPERMIAPAASAVHGLVYDDVKNSPTVEEFFTLDDPRCYGHPIEDPVVLIGHRISFDHQFVAPYITNVVQEVCTLRWVRRLFPFADDHKLGTMAYSLNLPRSEGAHRAMADVLTAYHLARHICERTGLTLQQLVQASEQPMKVHLMPFGKYRGQAIKDVPNGYLHWALSNTVLDADMKFSFEQELIERK